ncbi:MAG TPA: ATP-dependent 6-phosphofructokinase, partial [Bacteroidetes bacterium]|nr:ATP-dependent 6-phosphofructokinase [Bacteroidota bacterium]
MNHEDFLIKSLGDCDVESPLKRMDLKKESPIYRFVSDDERILYDSSLANFNHCNKTGEIPISFEKAGPREKIFFQPAKTKVAIVTCGGLCPGLNNVIRSLVNQCYYRYNITRIFGIK